MRFRDIIIKNLKYNIKRYFSYFFVNSFIVAVLFMYGSLLFNDILNADPAISSSQSLIVMAATAIIIFSLIFLTYTSIYFVKSRGKEFGVYLTLGMTTRDLTRMVILESFIVFVASGLIGTFAGLLTGKLFYLALGKVMSITSDLYFIGFETYLLSLGVLTLIFIFSMIFTSVFIRRLSIVDITKSSRTKGTSTQSSIIGIVSIFVFAFSLVLFHAVVAGQEWVIDYVRDYPTLSVILPLSGMLVSLFHIIGSGINGLRYVLKKFPSTYNKNILLLSGLSHRFLSYRVSLYSVTLLIAFAVFFIGVGMSFYNYGNITINSYQPYDFMVERRGDKNVISEKDISQLVKKNGGEVEKISSLPYLDVQTYRELGDRDGMFVNYRQMSYLVSESNFSQHTGERLSLDEDELFLVYNQKDNASEQNNFDTVIIVEPLLQGLKRAEEFRENPTSKKELINSLGNVQSIQFENEKTKSIFEEFVDSYGTLEFHGAMAIVVDDRIYEMIKGDQKNELFLFNLKSGDEKRIFNALLDELRKRNKADKSLWAGTDVVEGFNKENLSHLRPISKAERIEISFRANGFLLFALSFLGLLFLLSSCIVLYYKIISDSDEEAEQMSLLKKIGLTQAECRSYIQTHLAIIFFAPLLLGGAIGLYLVYDFVNFTSLVWVLVSKVALMYLVIVVLDVFLYFMLRKRFLRDVGI